MAAEEWNSRLPYCYLNFHLHMPWPRQELAASQLSAKRMWRAVWVRIASSYPLLRRNGSKELDGEKYSGELLPQLAEG